MDGFEEGTYLIYPYCCNSFMHLLYVFRLILAFFIKICRVMQTVLPDKVVFDSYTNAIYRQICVTPILASSAIVS